MLPNGVRMQCPECSWTCVMKSESDVPDGVRIVHEGVPLCPNHTPGIAMKPVASVDTTERPRTGITAAMTLEQIAGKVAELGREVEELADDLKRAAEEHKDAKKAYDAKVVTLRLAVERLGRVIGGEQIQADLPLLDAAEAEEGRCQAVTEGPTGPAVQCTRDAGHDGLHLNGIFEWGSDEIPDHIQALVSVLRSAGVDIGPTVVLTFTEEQRAQARAWGVDPDRSERPDFLPLSDYDIAPEQEHARVPRRRRAAKSVGAAAATV